MARGGRKRGVAARAAGTGTRSQGWGASSGVAGDSDSQGPNDCSVAMPVLFWRGGGLSSQLSLIVADPWTAIAQAVGISSRVIEVSR